MIRILAAGLMCLGFGTFGVAITTATDDAPDRASSTVPVAEKRHVQIEDEFAEKIQNVNELMMQKRFDEAIVVSKQARVLEPENPVAELMLYKAKLAKQEDYSRNNRERKADAAAAEEKIQRALSRDVALSFDDASLAEVMKRLAGLAEVNIIFDPAGLKEAGVTSNEKISINVEGIRLKSALNLILHPLRLGYMIRDDVLKITSIARATDSVEQLVSEMKNDVRRLQEEGKREEAAKKLESIRSLEEQLLKSRSTRRQVTILKGDALAQHHKAVERWRNSEILVVSGTSQGVNQGVRAIGTPLPIRSLLGNGFSSGGPILVSQGPIDTTAHRADDLPRSINELREEVQRLRAEIRELRKLLEVDNSPSGGPGVN